MKTRWVSGVTVWLAASVLGAAPGAAEPALPASAEARAYDMEEALDAARERIADGELKSAARILGPLARSPRLETISAISALMAVARLRRSLVRAAPRHLDPWVPFAFAQRVEVEESYLLAARRLRSLGGGQRQGGAAVSGDFAEVLSVAEEALAGMGDRFPALPPEVAAKHPELSLGHRYLYLVGGMVLMGEVAPLARSESEREALHARVRAMVARASENPEMPPPVLEMIKEWAAGYTGER